MVYVRMSADIVNLREFRKRKARDDKAARARESRARHGESLAQRNVRAFERKRDDNRLASKKLDLRDPPEPPK
jgi:hypothetical protein